MQAIDMTHIYGNKTYKGKWVALTDSDKPKVIAFGKTLKEILKKSAQKGIEHPVVTQIPKEILPIVGIL